MPPTASEPACPIPGRIGGVLRVLATLIAHARQFAATVATQVAVPEFAPVAAVFGTYDVPVILFRVRRGLLYALALQQYLLARAARGRNLRFAWKNGADRQPHHRPKFVGPAQASRPAPKPKSPRDPTLLGPDRPAAFRLPTQEELAAWVRRRPVGRTMAYICLDLGIVPCLCDDDFWNKVERVLNRYGGSRHSLYQVRALREKTFRRERDRRPDTWHIDWRYVPRATLRQALGWLIGDTPSEGPAPCLPVIAPS
jgi:hypothetical protein